MTSFVSTLCLVLLCSTIFFGSSALVPTPKSSLDGTYTLDQANSDNINDVIEEALRKMNVLKRFIARGRLKKLNPVYHQVAISSSPNEISVMVDNQPTLRTPAKGTSIAWVGPDGGKANVSMQLSGGHLVHIHVSRRAQG